MKLVRPLAVAVAFVAVLVPPSAASAQFFDVPGETPFGVAPYGRDNGELSVEVVLGAADGTGHVDISARQSNVEDYFELGRSVGDALGVERSESGIASRYDDPYGEAAYPIEIDLDGRLDPVVDGDPTFALDTTALSRVARNWDFSSLELRVCNEGLPLADATESSTARDLGDCFEWKFEGEQLQQAAAIDIRVMQQPDPENYWTQLALLAASLFAVGLALAMLVLVLRRKMFTHLNSSTLVMIVSGTLMSALSAGIAMFVFAFIDRPFIDLAAAHNLSEGGYAMSVVLMGLTAALPWLLPTLALCLAGTPDYTPQIHSFATQSPNPSAPGVPGWLQQQPRQQASQQSWQQVQQPPAPQQRAPESQSEPRPAEQRQVDDSEDPKPPDLPGWSPPA